VVKVEVEVLVRLETVLARQLVNEVLTGPRSRSRHRFFCGMGARPAAQ